jgi:hypothetical protein
MRRSETQALTCRPKRGEASVALSVGLGPAFATANGALGIALLAGSRAGEWALAHPARRACRQCSVRYYSFSETG